jgi:L-asparaginase II
VKARDGAGRAADVAAAALVARLLPALRENAELADLAAPTLTNWNGIAVGALRAGPEIRAG